LSVQITVVEPERLHRAQALHERPFLGQGTNAHGERKRDCRQEPFRDVRHEQADREDKGVGERQAGEEAEG